MQRIAAKMYTYIRANSVATHWIVQDRCCNLADFDDRPDYSFLLGEDILSVNVVDDMAAIDVSLASLHIAEMQEDDIIASVSQTIDNLSEESHDDGAERIYNVSDMNISIIDLPVKGTATYGKDTLEDSFILQVLGDYDDADVPENDDDVKERDSHHLEETLHDFGFRQNEAPAFLTKHPPPAIGIDDEIKKQKEVLDDVLVKTDSEERTDKIIFAPDHKIAANLFKLRESQKKNELFLPESPSLHLRKSKLTILCSAYKDAGILHILKYMRDEEFQEWKIGAY
ncbi:hypothetical protein MAR_013699 [Mya arenaria]|uniref:Reverse transcriptase domain-containing protein n=1 Tax=Mya arenaria TaxID=6604 RepID=A0ABY7G0Q6_MYAAR|nr:hypothetical protein MAR_013699 [Mya arenaria]